MLQHAYDFRDPGVLVHSNKSAETLLVKWSPVRHGSGGSLKVAALAWQDLVVPTLSMAADHGEFAFRSPHQPMQICGLGRYACGKATGCKPPTVVEALGISFNYKREEAFAQSG
jgi:hypothetical protein